MELLTNGFEASYAIAMIEPRIQPAHVFRRTRQASKSGALIVDSPSHWIWCEVILDTGTAWHGCFESGPGGTTGLFATPRPDIVCVVAAGQGFWVPVHAPDRFEIIRTIPIKQVVPATVARALVFVDNTRLAAYGSEGLQWHTEDVSWDGIKLTGVNADSITGLGWDSPAGRDVAFTVAIGTGAVDGGSSPSKYGVGR